MGFRRKDSSSSTTSSITPQEANVIWHNVGVPAQMTTVEDALLEANYAAYYQSDTYNEISAVAADLPVSHPTLDPNSVDYIGYPMPRPSISSETTFEPLADPEFPVQATRQPRADCPVHGEQKTSTAWPGTFEPEPYSNWSNIEGTTSHLQWRSQSDAGLHEQAQIDVPPRSRSDAGLRDTVQSSIPFDLSTPWNPTFPPYSKYYTPPVRKTEAEELEEEDDSGVGRPVAYQGIQHRLSELIDPADLYSKGDRYDSFSAVSSSSYSSRSSSLDRGTSRSVSPLSSVGNSRYNSRKGSFADSIKPLPPVLESPSGALFSASEFVAHPNRPLAIRERQEHIRAAIENIESQTRVARSASRNGSVDSSTNWKTGFGGDSRKGSKSSASSGASGTAYGGFGNAGGSKAGEVKTLEQIKIEEGRRAYEEKLARKDRGEGSRWGLGKLTGRRGS